MEIHYTVKTLEEIICYWIEAVNISRSIDNILETADQAGEVYEMAEWLEGDPDGKSIMGVVDSLENSSSLASVVMLNAENKLKLILDAAIENDDKRLSEYKGINYKEKLDWIVEALYENFDEIYAWSQAEQMENFYNALANIMSELE